MFAPALINFTIVSTSVLAGPKVLTILVFFISDISPFAFSGLVSPFFHIAYHSTFWGGCLVYFRHFSL